MLIWGADGEPVRGLGQLAWYHGPCAGNQAFWVEDAQRALHSYRFEKAGGGDVKKIHFLIKRDLGNFSVLVYRGTMVIFDYLHCTCAFLINSNVIFTKVPVVQGR